MKSRERYRAALVDSCRHCNKILCDFKLNRENKITQVYVYTPWGRYRYKRLPMGITSAPEIYQSKIEEVYEGIENFSNIYDDILLYTENIEQQCKVLKQTL